MRSSTPTGTCAHEPSSRGAPGTVPADRISTGFDSCGVSDCDARCQPTGSSAVNRCSALRTNQGAGVPAAADAPTTRSRWAPHPATTANTSNAGQHRMQPIRAAPHERSQSKSRSQAHSRHEAQRQSAGRGRRRARRVRSSVRSSISICGSAVRDPTTPPPWPRGRLRGGVGRVGVIGRPRGVGLGERRPTRRCCALRSDSSTWNRREEARRTSAGQRSWLATIGPTLRRHDLIVAW